MRNNPLIIIVLLVFIMASFGFNTFPAMAQARFTNNNDGTVTDKTSGLMWAQTDNQADIYWKDAQAWIKSRLSQSVGPQ